MKNMSVLDKIDNYFEFKKESEVKLYFGMAALLAAGLIYLLAWADAESYYDDRLSELTTVTANLEKVNSFLTRTDISGPGRNDRNFAINKKKEALAAQQERLTTLIDGNIYFDDRLKEVSTVTYNEQNWAKFLNDLSADAKKYGVKIHSILSDEREPEPGKVEQILNVNVNLTADFKSLLKYINAIEESQMVVDINGIDIVEENGILNGELNISLWGIKYEQSQKGGAQ